MEQFSKAINRFQKEDPTFRVHFEEESKEVRWRRRRERRGEDLGRV